ncbi:MAG: MOSC domain-containing protein [Candidatus Sericytochromatia bacterium]|nr:MOSC domain-containing protein [Candidatus Tanganyikabacteria bacterium]
MRGTVEAVCRKAARGIGKDCQPAVRLVAGHGVEGDVHAGVLDQHLVRKQDRKNLRQVHLIHAELHEELRAAGFGAVAAGRMGENVTTRGLPLLELPAGTRLRLGAEAIVEVTGLRTPCAQLDAVEPGLFAAVFPDGPEGRKIRKAGVMAIVLESGEVKPGDPIGVELPPEPHRPLEPV